MRIIFVIFIKTPLKTIVMIGTSIVLFRCNSSSQLNWLFRYFSSYSYEFLVINLIKYLVLLHSSSIFFYFLFISLVGTSVK